MYEWNNAIKIFPLYWLRTQSVYVQCGYMDKSRVGLKNVFHLMFDSTGKIVMFVLSSKQTNKMMYVGRKDVDT